MNFDEYEENPLEETLIQKGTRAFQQTIQMLRARGYTDFDRLSSSSRIESEEDLHYIASSDEDNQKPILVYWGIGPKFGVNDVRSMLVKCEEKQLTRAMLVTVEPIKSQTQTRLIHEAKKGFRVELFALDELQIDFSKHMYVPPHEVLLPEEVKELLEAYQIKYVTQLPKILTSDPMVRYLGLKQKQVVRIIRPGNQIHYRVVMGR